MTDKMTRAAGSPTTPTMTAAEAIERIGDREVVTSVSGGKDSAAAALHLRELGIHSSYCVSDTGWEHADTYRYINGPLTDTLGPITMVRAAVPVLAGYEQEVADMEAAPW